ncbi:MAG: proton-conducting transporter transmembrane domain-containing protein [Pirellulaceae bacterium]
MAFALILLPLVMAALAAVVPWNRGRPWLLPLTGTIHLVLTVVALLHPDLGSRHAWLVLDPPGRIILLQVSVLYLLCAFYAVGYLHHKQERSNRVFCVCLLSFLSAMSLVTWSHHLGLMWVGMETTTLVTAPLIYFNRTQRSIEATWKYLLVGSVGIALALLGTFFLAYAALHAGLESTLTFENLLENAPQLSKPWLHAAFVLLLVGYGTKMGLAPMHTWKPDAYGEAPGVVGAILAGGVTNCAFLALLRVYHICDAAGESVYTSRLLLTMGLSSMAVAGIFMVGQRDFKRMLAYSSVEHMGILTLGLGIGSPAMFGTLLHVITNGLTKGVLFLSAGNIQRAYTSKNIDQVRGAIRRLPLSGSLFLAGFLAITGSPPFGPFISEFAILNGAFDAKRFVVAGVFLFLLLVVFIGMSTTVLQVVQGRPPVAARRSSYRDGWLTVAPVIVFMALVLLLGLYIPQPLTALLNDAVRYLEVRL